MQLTRKLVESHAENHPYPDLSFYQMSQDREKWKRYGHWRVSHPLCGETVPLVTPITHVTKRTHQLTHIKSVKIEAIDLCGGIRFTCNRGYWIDIDLIDWIKLEQKIQKARAV